jgi:hypothetical protein
MGQCAAQVFTGVSRETFACLQGKAADQGITMEGRKGSGSKDGITVMWDYEADNYTLLTPFESEPQPEKS